MEDLLESITKQEREKEGKGERWEEIMGGWMDR